MRNRRNKCQVRPTTNLTANKQIAVHETGHIYAWYKKIYSQGNGDKKKEVSSTLPFMMIAVGLQMVSPFAS